MSPTAIGWTTVFLGSFLICCGIASYFYLGSILTVVLGVGGGIALVVISGLNFHKAEKAAENQ